MKQTIYKVDSDNFAGAYMTGEAYKALTLTMSTGDHATHKAVKVKRVPKGESVLTLMDIDPDAAIAKAIESYPKHLRDFAETKSFRAGMSKGGLDSYSNYSGHDLGSFVVSLGQSRDADLLTKANFEAALEAFGGETDTVKVERFGHWACGWFEIIVVDPRDRKALETAYSLHKLLQNYPVIDDSKYSEFENEERESDFETYQTDFEQTVLSVLGLDREDLKQSLSKAEYSRFELDLERLTRIIHEYDCGYRGTEEAFVTEDAVIRGLEGEDWLVSDLEYLGEYALAVVGREINQNFVNYDDKTKTYPNGPRVIEIGGQNE